MNSELTKPALDPYAKLGKRYVACPQCGSGLSDNFLKARDPEWIYCKNPVCVKTVAEIKRLAALKAVGGM